MSLGILCLSFFSALLSIPFTSAVTPISNTTFPNYSTQHTACIPIRDSIYGSRNVSYWVTEDGLAVIDGDVVYGSVDELFSRKLTRQGAISQRAHSIFAGPSTWPGATITYKYDSDATQASLTSIVTSAIADWKAAAPFLTFKQAANSAVGQNGVLTITAHAYGGCNSVLGFANTPLTMNLQQFSPITHGSCGVADAIHEFGHVLGLIHEHQRVDRENFVHYVCQNLDPTCTVMPAGKTCCDSGLPAGCCANAANFEIVSGPSFDASGSYDVNSVMHSTAGAFGKSGTSTLISVTPGVVVPVTNPTVIDSLDAGRVCKLYPTQCQKEIACRAAGCPSRCVPILPCQNPNMCKNPSKPLLCCEPTNCNSERAACAAMGCNFS